MVCDGSLWGVLVNSKFPKTGDMVSWIGAALLSHIPHLPMTNVHQGPSGTWWRTKRVLWFFTWTNMDPFVYSWDFQEWGIHSFLTAGYLSVFQSSPEFWKQGANYSFLSQPVASSWVLMKAQSRHWTYARMSISEEQPLLSGCTSALFSWSSSWLPLLTTVLSTQGSRSPPPLPAPQPPGQYSFLSS